MTAVFVSQIVLGLLVYGRGWWHGAFGPSKDGKQVFVEVKGLSVNLSAIGNIVIGLGLLVVGILGLVLS